MNKDNDAAMSVIHDIIVAGYTHGYYTDEQLDVLANAGFISADEAETIKE